MNLCRLCFIRFAKYLQGEIYQSASTTCEAMHGLRKALHLAEEMGEKLVGC